MEFVNYTPFSPFLFQSEDAEQRPFDVVVLRGTFAIDDGRPLRPLPEQEPVVRADRYRGQLHRSSLLVDSDLAPFKPRSDIHIEAVAQAPGGRPLPSWSVGVRIGSLDKALRVTGPRCFRHARRRWILSEPEPCVQVPVIYEHAFGGRQLVDGQELVDEHNPVGLGWLPPDQGGSPRDRQEIPAPRIESPDEPVLDLGRSYPPQGLGPICRAWLPRRALAGTLDEAWRAERCPALPQDFDFAYYNSAHPDLIYPGFLRGDEHIELEGLDEDGLLRCSLPGFVLSVCLRNGQGDATEQRCELDTLRLDLPRRRASLTWRARCPGQGVLTEVMAHMDRLSPSREVAEEHHGRP